ncbi:MAG: DUF533 domain-containing protein [Vicinamibacterales bacterium]
MDPANLLGALVRGALAGKPRKRSKKALRFLTGNRGGLVNAATMMTAAGVAWGLFETWQNNQQGQASGGGQWGGHAAGPAPPAAPSAAPSAPMPAMPAMTPPAAGLSVPPPLPGAQPGPVSTPPTDVPPAVLRLVRLTVSAARADGALGSEEREAILAQARSVGAEPFVLGELDRATPLSEIVADVTDTREKEALYALAFSIVRADEGVTGSERIYLAQLAALLGLDAASTARLEQEMASRIDAQDDSN